MSLMALTRPVARVLLNRAVLHVAATRGLTPPAEGHISTLTPTAITTASGSTGGQPVWNLAVQDQSGTADNWNKYVEFIGKYSGYLTFAVPSGVAASSVTGIEARVNYRGPSQPEQKWSFSLYNWAANSWVEVGTNASAPSWGAWTLLTFNAPGAPQNYISASRAMRLQLAASNNSDAADIDYAALVLSTSAAPTPTVTATASPSPTASPPPTASPSPSATSSPPPPGQVMPPPPNAKFDYQIGGAYTPPAGVQVVSRDREAPTAPGLYNICYVNAFQTQPDALSYWEDPSRVHLITFADGQRRYDGDWGEFAFDISTAAKRQELAGIVNGWITKCKNDGFKAVEPDNLDTYTRFSGLTQANASAFAKLLIDHAHSVGLAIGQKNTAEFNGKPLGFDFAVAEECGRYNECGTYMGYYGNNVIVIEYRDQDFTSACNNWGSQLSIVRRDVNVTPGGPYNAC